MYIKRLQSLPYFFLGGGVNRETWNRHFFLWPYIFCVTVYMHIIYACTQYTKYIRHRYYLCVDCHCHSTVVIEPLYKSYSSDGEELNN